MKRSMAVIVILLAFILSACTVQNQVLCDHCHEMKNTSNHLIGEIDMEICENCYDGFLQGAWGEEYKK